MDCNIGYIKNDYYHLSGYCLKRAYKQLWLCNKTLEFKSIADVSLENFYFKDKYELFNIILAANFNILPYHGIIDHGGIDCSNEYGAFAYNSEFVLEGAL